MAKAKPQAREIWLDGEYAGQPVNKSPIKIHTGVAYRLDPAAQEAALKRTELERLGDLGKLQNQEEYFEARLEMARGARRAAEASQKDPSLVAIQRPASPWPMRILVGCMALMLVTVLVLAWQVARLASGPTLPSQGAEVASGGVLEPSQAAPTQKSGVGIANRLQGQP